MTRRSGESGFALLTTMAVLVFMLTAGLSLAAIVDTQTGASAAQRHRDSAFNLAESVMAAQVFALAREWPGVGTAATPYTSCTQTSTSTRCPGTTVIQGTVSPDVQTGATWQTSVHDNNAVGGQSFYSDALILARPGYDANGDGRVWVRAQATTRGRSRLLVALVAAEQQEEPIPHGALIADRLTISNNGNKTLIAANGALVGVHCMILASDSTPCLGHTLSGSNGTLAKLMANLATQISGTTPQTGYTGGVAMTAEGRARIKATAIANGSYYASCPSAAQLNAQVVYVESGDCSYTSNSQFNSATAPGFLLVNSGSVSFGGTSNFYGVIYNANAANSSGHIVSTQGNSQITGGVLIDGAGRFEVGSSGLNIVFDPNAYASVRSYGSAGVIQNTWREIKPNQ